MDLEWKSQYQKYQFWTLNRNVFQEALGAITVTFEPVALKQLST